MVCFDPEVVKKSGHSEPEGEAGKAAGRVASRPRRGAAHRGQNIAKPPELLKQSKSSGG
jgi:hypothetical protein